MTVLRMARTYRRLTEPHHTLRRNQYDHPLVIVAATVGDINTRDIVPYRNTGYGTAGIETNTGR